MAATNEDKKLYGIDLVKGILIILVFISHLLRGEADETLLRYALYGFHMPLFMAISGFLMNPEDDLRVNIKKHAKRLVIPFVIAYIFYYVIVNHDSLSIYGALHFLSGVGITCGL